MYGGGGVTRRKDVPRTTALADALASGALASRFADHECEAFTRFMKVTCHDGVRNRLARSPRSSET